MLQKLKALDLKKILKTVLRSLGLITFFISQINVLPI